MQRSRLQAVERGCPLRPKWHGLSDSKMKMGCDHGELSGIKNGGKLHRGRGLSREIRVRRTVASWTECVMIYLCFLLHPSLVSIIPRLPPSMLFTAIPATSCFTRGVKTFGLGQTIKNHRGRCRADTVIVPCSIGCCCLEFGRKGLTRVFFSEPLSTQLSNPTHGVLPPLPSPPARAVCWMDRIIII